MLVIMGSGVAAVSLDATASSPDLNTQRDPARAVRREYWERASLSAMKARLVPNRLWAWQ
jgi:hypothetical protein